MHWSASVIGLQHASGRFACRQLVRNPGFAITAIVVLALGIGASVAIFAFVDAALIKPRPYKDPARLVSLYEVVNTCPLCNISYQNYQDWKKSNLPFSSIEAGAGLPICCGTQAQLRCDYASSHPRYPKSRSLAES